MRRSRASVAKVVGLVLVVWVAGLVSALSTGFVPDSARSWVLFLLFAPPVALVGEVFIEFIAGQFDDPLATRRQTIIRLVALLLVIAGVVVAIWLATA